MSSDVKHHINVSMVIYKLIWKVSIFLAKTTYIPFQSCRCRMWFWTVAKTMKIAWKSKWWKMYPYQRRTLIQYFCCISMDQEIVYFLLIHLYLYLNLLLRHQSVWVMTRCCRDKHWMWRVCHALWNGNEILRELTE